MDKQNGIYVVTSLYMCKVNWDKATTKITLTWATKYHETNQLTYWGRFGPGSGSSPSLMGKDGAEYVVITDGSQEMNILHFDAQTGKIMSKLPIDFGTKGIST